jgi:hypothetical protein
MARSLIKKLLIALACLFLVAVLVIAISNGWLDLQGRPIQRLKELQGPADQRNRQIEDLADP